MKKDKRDFIVRFYRIMGLYVTKLLLYTPITANQVSFLIFILTFIIFILFSFGEFWYSIAGFIILHLNIILDAVDGKIARYRKTASIRGAFVDLIAHSLTGPLVFFGLTIGVFRNTNNLWFLFFGIVAAIFSFLIPNIQRIKHQVLVVKLMEYAKGENLEELKDKKLEVVDTEAGNGKKFLFWRSIVKKIMDYLKFEFNVPLVLIPAVIFDFTPWVLVFYGIALPIKWLIVILYEFKINYKHLEYLFKPYQPK